MEVFLQTAFLHEASEIQKEVNLKTQGGVKPTWPRRFPISRSPFGSSSMKNTQHKQPPNLSISLADVLSADFSGLYCAARKQAAYSVELQPTVLLCNTSSSNTLKYSCRRGVCHWKYSSKVAFCVKLQRFRKR